MKSHSTKFQQNLLIFRGSSQLLKIGILTQKRKENAWVGQQERFIMMFKAWPQTFIKATYKCQAHQVWTLQRKSFVTTTVICFHNSKSLYCEQLYFWWQFYNFQCFSTTLSIIMMFKAWPQTWIRATYNNTKLEYYKGIEVSCHLYCNRNYPFKI